MQLPSKRRLLVFEMRMLGDAVISLPFIRAALAEYEVFICCNPDARQLFETMVPSDRLTCWYAPWLKEEGKYRPSRWHLEELRALRHALQGIRADVAVSVWPDAREHILMALSGAGVRVGFPMNRRNYLAHERPWRMRHLRAGQVLSAMARLGLFRPLLTRKLNRHDYRQAHLEAWHQLAEALKLKWDATVPWLPTCGPAGAGGAALERLCGSAHAAGGKVWLLHTGARLPSKQWPLQRFQELVDTSFAGMDAPLLIIKPPNGPWPMPRSDRHLLVETPSVRDLTRVIAMADCVVCNDSFVSHLASALGKRVIAIFSSGNPEWFGPHGNADLVIRTDMCPHHPCMDRCAMPSYVCQESVTTAMVRDAIERLLREIINTERASPERAD